MALVKSHSALSNRQCAHSTTAQLQSLRLLPAAAPAFQRRRVLRQPVGIIQPRAGGAVIDLKAKWWEKNNADNMRSISSVDDFITELSQARDKLVIVDFFARWCGSCKALHPKLCHLAADNPDALVLKVEFDSNKQLARALDVKVLPFFQFYRGAEGRVAAFSASVAKVQRLRDALSQYSSPRCSLGTSPVVSELSSLLDTDSGGRVVPGPAAQEQNAQAVPV